MSRITLLVVVRSLCEVGKRHNKTFSFCVTEAPPYMLVGDTIEVKQMMLTVESRSWNHQSKRLVLGCVAGQVPFQDMFKSGKVVTENETYLDNVVW